MRLYWFFSWTKLKILISSLFQHYDLVISLNRRSGSRFFQLIKAKRKIGCPYSQMPSANKMHNVEKLQNTYLPELNKTANYIAPKLFLGEDKVTYNLPEKYIVLVITTSKFKSKSIRGFKNWPVAHWQELIKLLANNNQHIIITHVKNETKFVQKFIGTNPEKIQGLTLPADQLCNVIKKASLLITADTGPVHAAYYLNTPLIAIFGPSSVGKTGPYKYKPDNSTYVFKSKLKCSPCYFNNKSCQINKCMLETTPQMVFKKTMEMLRDKGGGLYNS